MVIGAIFAGGIGSRMGSADMPKQYLQLGSKPIIVHTIEKFVVNPGIDRIIVLCPKAWIAHTKDLVKKYLGTVVPTTDNFYATLNSAVFTDGSFVFVPKGVRCPMELSTYFRINAENTGQFERTLIIADKGAHVSYLEGCTAPKRDTNQLHAAVVELVILEDAEIKYSTVQNWFPGDEDGKGGIYNFVTKRAECRGDRSKVTWTQVETGSAITWKYPSCVLLGDDSVGEFHSVALTHHRQQADTGTKMIHIGKRTKSKIVSKGISAGRGQNTGIAFVSLKDWSERPGEENKVEAITQRAMGAFSQIKDAMVFAFNLPAIVELGTATGFDFQLQDKSGLGHEALLQARNQLLGMAAQNKNLVAVRPNGQEDQPQLRVDIDREKAGALSLSLADINAALSTVVKRRAHCGH